VPTRRRKLVAPIRVAHDVGGRQEGEAVGDGPIGQKEPVVPPACLHSEPADSPPSTTPASQHSRRMVSRWWVAPDGEQVDQAAPVDPDHVLRVQLLADIVDVRLVEQGQVGGLDAEPRERLVEGADRGGLIAPSRHLWTPGDAEGHSPGWTLPARNRLSTEAEVIEAHQVARNTVRDALALLVHEGDTSAHRVRTSFTVVSPKWLARKRMSSTSRRRAARTFMASRCSGNAADTRRPGWSKTRGA
jgi:hypothetical protein